MKIIILPWPNGPDYYEFDGEVITATHGGVSDSYDLSVIPEGATLTTADKVNGADALLSAIRVNGNLHVTLCQQTGSGHWMSSEEFNISEYDPDAVHVSLDTKRYYAGRAWAKTRQGKQYVGGGE